MNTKDVSDSPQRIARLTPLTEVLASIDARVGSVAARTVEPGSALGRILAEDVMVQAPVPRTALALRDGWALQSDLTADAGPYASAPLASAKRIETGEPLPSAADAVAPLDAVTLQGGSPHALSPISPGEGALPIGADAAPGSVLIQAGRRLGPLQIALLLAAGIKMVRIREPRICLVRARSRSDLILEEAIECIADAVGAGGAVANIQSSGAALDRTLNDSSMDAVIIVGGTGTGARDSAVRAMAAAGELHVHGVALAPGETAAFASVRNRPVLALPGRLDAVLAVWLLIGRRMLARLTGRTEEEPSMTAKLARKVASSLGVAEVVPVRVRAGAAEPLGSGYLTIATLAQADGWVMVPPDSEGYPAGSEVVIRAWP